MSEMIDYLLKLPKVVYGGAHAMDNLLLLCKGAKKITIFTDKGIIENRLLEKPKQIFGEIGTPYEIIDDLPAEPTVHQANDIAARYRKTAADLIVAIGGGSVMDIAKLCSILDTDAYTVYDLLKDPQRGRKAVRTVMIPTTAGTGAEATPNAIVTIPEEALKVGIVNEEMIADAVILDAEMIRKLPYKIAAATGVDALAHAVECFTSRKANPFSDLYALEAFALIEKNLENACDDTKEDMDAKRAMLTASFYAGIAITASGTTGVHALSYPLGGRYHIPHGISNAIMLIPVMRFNECACAERLAQLYDRIRPQGEVKKVEEKSAYVLRRMEAMVKNVGIAADLSLYDVSAGDLEDLVCAGMKVTRLLVNNMREITVSDARCIYKAVLK